MAREGSTAKVREENVAVGFACGRGRYEALLRASRICASIGRALRISSKLIVLLRGADSELKFDRGCSVARTQLPSSEPLTSDHSSPD